MKSKEEINDLAEIHANQEMEVYKSMDLPKGTKQAIFTHCLVSYNIAYTQCQEDMADKWFEYPKNIPPIHSENYLIVDNGYIQISLFRGDYNKFQHELVGAEKCNITHWKPLPNKPLNKLNQTRLMAEKKSTIKQKEFSFSTQEDITKTMSKEIQPEEIWNKESQEKIKEHILNLAKKQTPKDRLETELMAKKYKSEDYATKIMEVAYYGFPLVQRKETVHKIINALLIEYAEQK